MNDPNFERTVVLLCEHNEEGSFGLVLNRVIEDTLLHDVVENIEKYDHNVYLGGPVGQDVLQFLHVIDSLPGSIEVLPGLFLGGDFDLLQVMMQNGNVGKDDVRFYVGYSGWAAGQLHEELEGDVWVVSNIQSNQVFKLDVANLWQEVLKNMGGKYKMISNFPVDPRMN